MTLAAGTTNTSIIGSNDTIHAAGGSTFNVTGSNDTIIGSNLTLYLNAGDANITLQGNNDVVHIRSGVTGQIQGTNDSVIVDTVITAHNGDTIQHYNGTSNLIDLPALAFDSSITATPVLNGGHTAGQLVIADHGATAATINLTSINSIGSFTVRSDGSGGTLLVDPVETDSQPPAFGSSGNTVPDGFHFETAGFQAAASSVTGAGRAVGVTNKDSFDFGVFNNPPAKTELPGTTIDGFDHASATLPHGGDFGAGDSANILLELNGRASLEPTHPAVDPHSLGMLPTEASYWHLHA